MKKQNVYVPNRGNFVLGKKRKVSHGKVSKNFSGECQLSQLQDNTYFKLVKKDGSLSKKIYIKQKGDYNKSTRKYDICSVDDVWGGGRSMHGKTKVSTKFIY